MAALSPLFNTSSSLFCCRSPKHHLCSQWRHPIVISCSASTGRARARRKPMSDADLRKGLLEFVSSFGFPDGHCPSTKELAEHGRKDLSNIVRRRGYKIVRELLANSNEISEGSNFKDNSAEEQNDVHDVEYSITEKAMGEDSAEYVSSSENNIMPIKPPQGSSLQEKLEKFLTRRIVDFEAVEDVTNEKFWLQDSQGHGEYNKDSAGYSSILDQRNSGVVGPLLNGTAVMSKQIANAAEGGNITRENSYLSHDVPSDADADQHINTFKRENEVELEQLKNKLQLKELELSKLKELIEKEEESLSLLQIQAEDEFKRTEMLISEMDVELLAADDSLDGLKEVAVEYLGEGEVIEVAGSFNGWHQRIRMDPQPSSNGKISIDSRNPRLWSALLWLYPGDYEIKFVVDGEWKIDPTRESTNRSGMQNNVLRVDG